MQIARNRCAVRGVESVDIMAVRVLVDTRGHWLDRAPRRIRCAKLAQDTGCVSAEDIVYECTPHRHRGEVRRPVPGATK